MSFGIGLLTAGEDFGEMEAFHRANVAVEPASDLHQAARVVADNIVGLGLADGIALHFGHRRGNLRIFDGKSTTEPAAGFRFRHLDKFKAFDMTQQFPRRLLCPQLAQSMTAVMEGGTRVEPRTDIGDAEFVDQKF